MNKSHLQQLIVEKQTCLCVGLDPDLSKIPAHLLKKADPIFEFNKSIIDATRSYCVAYKPNLAFYEVLGAKGWKSLQKTVDYIGDTHFKIADAKRGDIGNTAKQYAKSVFETLNFDAITLSPYMGYDSVEPFLNYPNKWVILLALTSNRSAANFQLLKTENKTYLFENIIQKSLQWPYSERIMYVVGATNAAYLSLVRKLAPNCFLLIPGIGAQGGDINSVVENGATENINLLINIARSIIYAGIGEDFQEAVTLKAKEYQLAIQTEIAKLKQL